MRRRMFVFLIAVGVFIAVGIGQRLAAGEPGSIQEPRAVSPSPAADPFAGVLENSAVEIQKIGPSCQFIKIQLPEGISPEDIPGLQTP